MSSPFPTLHHPLVTLRGLRRGDWRALERALTDNRSWLQAWEATSPVRRLGEVNPKASVRQLLSYAKSGGGLPMIMELDHQLVGQLNVSQITHGSLSSASLGYWVVEEYAGRGITPVAVALATDYLFFEKGLHRMEICIRPENTASFRIVEKLGFRFEGLRRRYIHIDGQWRDHLCFALTVEEVPGGVLNRFERGLVPPGLADVPQFVQVQMRNPLHLPPR